MTPISPQSYHEIISNVYIKYDIHFSLSDKHCESEFETFEIEIPYSRHYKPRLLVKKYFSALILPHKKLIKSILSMRS